MTETEEARRERAAAAVKEEIASLLHDPSAEVVRTLLGNRNITEEDVLIIATRKNLPASILEAIFRDKRWSESYPVRLALARNPKSPLTVSLTIARYLRLFDLEEITRSHFIPLVFRHKVEGIIVEKIPAMALGNKKTLAKKASGAVLVALLRDPDAEVVKLCLNNPHLIEAHLFKIISRADTVAETIRLIAEHPNWSRRSLIRLSLARNSLTPLPLTVRFLREMKIMDLRELYADPALSVTVRPFIHRELWERGEEAKSTVEDQVFEIDEEEMAELDAEGALQEYREEEEKNQE
ncbi:MAG TPA: hypothetical protein VIX18_00290 [Nitrospirota bacterium]